MTSRSFLAAWAELDLARHKAEWYRMWYAGYRAGLGHAKLFETAGEFRRSPTVERMRQHLLEHAHARRTLSDAIRDEPRYFAPFEAALLELGEESGTLEETLRLLGAYFQGEHRMMLWVKKKMSYPMINGIAAVFIAPLPVLIFGNTLSYLLTVTAGFTSAMLFGGTILAAVSKTYQQRPSLVLARLLRGLSLAVEAGLSLERSLDLGVAAAGSEELARHVARVPREQRRGQSLAETFRRVPVVPHEVVAALEIADKTGNYRDTLQKLAQLYDGEALK